jgi:regulator of sirC expression with transglutaminase-like and TPR domain
MPTKTEIESLIYLLDDPDPYVKTNVKNRLFELGEQAVPLLDEQKSQSNDDDERELINDIIQWITYGSLEEDFMDVLENGVSNMEQLESAILVLARFENPTLRELEYKRKLDRFAGMLRDDLKYELDDSKKMHLLLDFVFDELSFRGSNVDYYNPDNSYLHRVIDRRQGLPISLGLIVLFLARRLGLPFYGVNMPIHFMLKYKGELDEIMIDPFDRGKTVTYNQCYFFLKQNGIEPKSEHFNTAQPYEILARCIRNLIQSYSRLDKYDKVDNLKNLLAAVETMTAQG